jgi:3-hydroxyisobutyrate dehydrogenase-like beta-hydroxyacid dehydrogenase
MSGTQLSVACIGLGRIGSGIARNVQASGCRLIVYNRNPQKTEPLVASGAARAVSPREAAAAADIVITSLMDDHSVLENVKGDAGILAGMRPGAIHIGTSTVSPRASTQLAALHASHGSQYVAAPVVGRPDAAAAGKLITFVAGKAEAVERCRPVIETYAAKMIVLGDDPAAAPSLKLVVNFFGASMLEVMGEALVFAEKRGLNLELVGGMFKELIHHPAMPVYLDKIRTRKFDDDIGFTLDGGLKDVQLMLDAAAEVHLPIPCASLIRDKCLTAKAHGMGQRDWSVFTEVTRINAGDKVQSETAVPRSKGAS